MTSTAIILFLFAAPEADARLLELARALDQKVQKAAAPRELVPLLEKGGFDLAILCTREEAGRLFAGPGRLMTLAEAEKRHILYVLAALEGNKSLTARTLGVDPKTLYNKLNLYKNKGVGRRQGAAGLEPF